MVRTRQLVGFYSSTLVENPCDFKELTPEELAQVAHKRLETKLDVFFWFDTSTLMCLV